MPENTEDKKTEKNCFPIEGFDELELKDFESLKQEYEHLYEEYEKSKEREELLTSKAKELSEIISNNAVRLQSAIKLSQEDQNTIETLKNEVKKAWELLNFSNIKEKAFQEKSENMEAENDRMTSLLEHELELKADLKRTLESLDRETQDLRATISRKDDLLANKTEEHQGAIKEISSLTTTIEKNNEEKKKLSKTIVDTKHILEREKCQTEKLKKELSNAQSSVASKNHVIENQTTVIQRVEHEKNALYNELKKVRDLEEKLKHSLERMTQRSNNLETQTQTLETKLEETKTKILAYEREIKLKDELITTRERREKAATFKVEKEKEVSVRLKEEIAQLKGERSELQNQVRRLSSDVDVKEKAAENSQANLVKEKQKVTTVENHAAKLKERLGAATGKARIDLRCIRNVENELRVMSNKYDTLEKQLSRVEKEREAANVTANEAKEKSWKLTEELKARENQTVLQLKKNTELELKLQKQQKLYEQARSERNYYSKNLVESREAVQDLEKKIVLLQHHTEQLREEISSKDRALIKEHFDMKQVINAKDKTKVELSKMHNLLGASKKVVVSQNGQIKQMAKMVRCLDQDMAEQKQEYTTVLNEREILSTHLVRRNDEILILNNKNRLLESTIQNLNRKVNDKEKDIEHLQLTLKEAKREIEKNKDLKVKLRDCRKKIYSQTKELNHERSKAKAVADELENHFNVHRIRFLDDESDVLQLKGQTALLQREVLNKRQTITNLEMELEENKQLNSALKDKLATFNKVDWHEARNLKRFVLRKGSEVRALTAEINMQQLIISSLKREIKEFKKAENRFLPE
eukprot:augustus_masked-scaffold_7-processed-gene-5.6-mRNA-1 protein AED:0.80 eAED:0.81 QI:0/-1/0/1/-1/1/1/0/815